MPRRAREISPTGYYHVMMRGINRDFIYRSNGEKAYFLRTMREATELSPAAYCVMDNHVHVVVHAGPETFKSALRKMNLKYAMWYNSVHDRVGHVFQNRYRSEIITSEVHLLHVIRYVHNNPLKAGLANDAKQYTWSSYREYLGNLDVVAPAQRQFVLGLVSGGLEGLSGLHEEHDEHEYLDTDEDAAEHRISLARAIISRYCIAHGIGDSGSLKQYPEHIGRLAVEVLKRTKLSHRKLAALLEVSANTVHRANLNQQVQR